VRCPDCGSALTVLVLSKTTRGECDSCGATWSRVAGRVEDVTPRAQEPSRSRVDGIAEDTNYPPPRVFEMPIALTTCPTCGSRLEQPDASDIWQYCPVCYSEFDIAG
jgi:ribosomal protein L37AE/L43A